MVMRLVMNIIKLADAKAHLSDLVDQVEAGNTIEITRHGKAVAQLSPVQRPRKTVNLAILQSLTKDQPRQVQDAADLVRSMRDGARY
jgi:prevent-host-death family protein